MTFLRKECPARCPLQAEVRLAPPLTTAPARQMSLCSAQHARPGPRDLHLMAPGPVLLIAPPQTPGLAVTPLGSSACLPSSERPEADPVGMDEARLGE